MKNQNLTTEDLDRLEQLMKDLANAKQSKAESNLIRAKIMDFMRANNIKSFKHNDIMLRFVEERTTIQFDVQLLKSKYPDIWKECHGEAMRPADLIIQRTTPDKDDPTDEELAEAIN